MAEVFVDGENIMPVRNINQLEGHIGGMIHGIFIPTGRAETNVTAEGYEFKLAAFRTVVHDTTIGRSPHN